METYLNETTSNEGFMAILMSIFSIALGRFIESQLYGVTPLDLSTYIIGPLCLAAVALLANILPARRMLGVDTVETLRVE